MRYGMLIQNPVNPVISIFKDTKWNEYFKFKKNVQFQRKKMTNFQILKINIYLN